MNPAYKTEPCFSLYVQMPQVGVFARPTLLPSQIFAACFTNGHVSGWMHKESPVDGSLARRASETIGMKVSHSIHISSTRVCCDGLATSMAFLVVLSGVNCCLSHCFCAAADAFRVTRFAVFHKVRSTIEWFVALSTYKASLVELLFGGTLSNGYNGLGRIQ